MNLRSYQSEASVTDILPSRDDADLMIALLGLAGEVGELQSEYKKALRDGDGPDLFRGRFAEELGDLLWYVANLATKLGFDLDEIAEQNLAKSRERWGLRVGISSPVPSFDKGYPESQRLPRKLRIEIKPAVGPQDKPIAQAYV